MPNEDMQVTGSNEENYDSASIKVLQGLEAVRSAGEMLHIQVLGLAVIAADVSPELARATIASVHVLGALQASAAVKAALTERIR